MSTRHNNHKPLSSSHLKIPPQDRVLASHIQSHRVLVIETLNAAEDVIRVSIETVASQRLPERIITF